MASEIKVDTVSEKTSANGVTIDGVNIKDSALVTAGSVPLSTIDIDGGTDIGAAVVDADLFIIDDGAGGTNRKVTASRVKTYAGVSGDVTTIDSLLKADIKIGEDDQTKIDFETADEIHLYAANAEQVYVADGIFGPQTDSDVDLGTTGVRWKNAYIDTITTTGLITANARIAFPASATVGTDANELDDYQEGTLSLSSSQADNFLAGYYTKIGRMVFWTAQGTLPTSTNSASQTITGLPFTNRDSDSGAVNISFSDVTTVSIEAKYGDNAATFFFFHEDNNVATHATYSAKTIRVGGHYTTVQ